MQYDATIIKQFAENLYSRAKSIIFTYTVLGLVIGIAAGTAALPVIGTAIGGAFFGLFGFLLGRDKAFQLKLQAQTALCQVQIEQNTGGGEPPAFMVDRH